MAKESDRSVRLFSTLTCSSAVGARSPIHSTSGWPNTRLQAMITVDCEADRIDHAFPAIHAVIDRAAG